MRRLFALAVLLLVALLVSISVATAAPTDAVIPVEQIFTLLTSSPGIDDGFTYELIAREPGNPLPAGSSGNTYTFKLNGSTKSTLSPIVFTHAGVFEYQIGMRPGPKLPNYTYDERIYFLTIYVKNTATGLASEIIARTAGGDKVDAITFEKSYGATPTDPALMVDPPVRKTVAGNPAKNGTFTFTLTAADPTQPMPAGSKSGVKTMTIVGPGEDEFGTWQYTQPGVYYYTIAEVNSREDGYTYDTNIYTITDTVTDVSGQLMLSRIVTNAANRQVDAAIYINTYTSKGVGPGKTVVDGPQTGDFANPQQMIITMIVSGAVALACVVFLIVQKEDEKRGA